MPLYPKESGSLVYDLIMQANPDLPIKLTPSNCRLEGVTAVTPSAATNNRNTKVKLHGLQGEGFEDIVTVYYDRVDLNKVIVDYTRTNVMFVTFTAPTLHKALPVINDTYGLILSEKDIADSQLYGVEVADYNTTVNIAALPTCPAYRGQVTVKYSRGKRRLESLTTLTNPVLVHPLDPAYGKTSIDMLTYGLDFTAHRALLEINAGGFAKWGDLRTLLDNLGIPAYAGPSNGNTVQDALTTAVAGANTAYDRVVVQSGINGETTRGMAYYHYNT